MSLKSFLSLLMKAGADDDQLYEGIDLWERMNGKSKPEPSSPAAEPSPVEPEPDPDDLVPVDELAEEFGYGRFQSLLANARRNPELLTVIKDDRGTRFMSRREVSAYVKKRGVKSKRGRKLKDPLPKVKRAPTLEVQSWVTIKEASRQLGIPPHDVEYHLREGRLAIRRFESVNITLVHVRQIAYWIEHRSVLDVDLKVFSRWLTASQVAECYGADKSFRRDRVAVYTPTPALVLYSDEDIRRELKIK